MRPKMYKTGMSGNARYVRQYKMVGTPTGNWLNFGFKLSCQFDEIKFEFTEG